MVDSAQMVQNRVVPNVKVPGSDALLSLESSPSNYLPSLDGWRAISILAVMLSHSAYQTYGFLSTKWLWDHGHVGVDVFFSISGLLICSRLLEEERKHGVISLSQFYIRRFFRIIPPALLYLSVIAILTAFALIHVGFAEWMGALFFYRNYTRLVGGDPRFEWFTGHFWSLSVEEHFYIILPALLLFTRKRFRLLMLSLLIILVAFSAAVQMHTRAWEAIQFHSDVRLNSLLIPAVFAVLITQPGARRWFQSLARLWPITVVLLFLLVTFWSDDLPHVLGLAVLMPIAVLSTVLNSRSYLGRFLELTPLRYVGRISYSLYLWQQLFFVDQAQFHARSLGRAQQWPLCMVLTFACAIASYYFVETPAIRLGRYVASSFRKNSQKSALPTTQTSS